MRAIELKRSRPVFPIGTVMELTDLTARQIRYYEEYQLVVPRRSASNRRMYSLNDIDLLLEIADLIESGMTLKGVQTHFRQKKDQDSQAKPGLTDQDVRRILRDELGMERRYK